MEASDRNRHVKLLRAHLEAAQSILATPTTLADWTIGPSDGTAEGDNLRAGVVANYCLSVTALICTVG